MTGLPAMRTVYGVLLNSRAEFEAWAPRMREAPYKAPPAAPVLYIKPANTWSASEARVPVPPGVPQVEIGATVGMLIDPAGEAGGFLLVNDLSTPQASYFRPPVRANCLDGFLGLGAVVPAQGQDPARFALEVRVNGELKQSVRFDALVRPPHRLLADVAEFMTLGAGDVLMLGLAPNRPLARAGDTIEIRAPALGRLVTHLVAEGA
ncbi:fumarylacetoacetate hydrolase family protein [Ramlibacter solisilvae]|uniref:Fumarylacetoacetate hydrolase n=1 Tax=Ramlibacter tataouinensis TaxID=94132 RepID=A0A127JTG8_9BURK|nr:fumarylacetoacetate hydrolase family protein [Ramlibacter tataouinensis]AMO23328.1 fumarylacetoacetate hydrolase [Ramlibacter tataouinensis]